MQYLLAVAVAVVAVAVVVVVVPHHGPPSCEPPGAAGNWGLRRQSIRGAFGIGSGANNGGRSWRARERAMVSSRSVIIGQ